MSNIERAARLACVSSAHSAGLLVPHSTSDGHNTPTQQQQKCSEVAESLPHNVFFFSLEGARWTTAASVSKATRCRKVAMPVTISGGSSIVQHKASIVPVCTVSEPTVAPYVDR